ncbi:hypothetical protein [Pseudomonas phage vB_PaeM_PS3]|uniref:Uncharacterized protein n=1 Tax=Pseudomonas phage PaGz-1 TaxID=2419748 RepID=A0A411B991_9CAUD|nr:hypothetical protein QE322_gp133 [Pseudomonas phage PaGz-1]QAX98191.1 hypothetical protein [Pseudomonas phage PaGz-1]UZO33135.1 hypothetical protein CBSLWZGG_CDS102 [Pseudomonas phage PseuPha1]
MIKDFVKIISLTAVVVGLLFCAVGLFTTVLYSGAKAVQTQVEKKDIIVSTEDGTINLGHSVKSEKLLYSMCIKVEDNKPACEFTTKDKVVHEVRQVMRPGESTARDIKIAVNAAVTYTGENGQKATSLIPPKGEFLPAGTPSEVHIETIDRLFDSVYNDYKQNFSKM